MNVSNITFDSVCVTEETFNDRSLRKREREHWWRIVV